MSLHRENYCCPSIRKIRSNLTINLRLYSVSGDNTLDSVTGNAMQSVRYLPGISKFVLHKVVHPSVK